MSAPAELRRPGARRFRAKLLIAMMLVVSTIAALALAVAQRNLETAFEQELRREFQAEIAALHNVQAVRQAALLERCRVLVRRSRIHAALEDGALDLLYPSAKDELRDIMATPEGSGEEHTRYGLQAEFYRFLDRDGAVIPPSREHEVGTLSSAEARQRALRAAPVRQQLGYIVRQRAARGASLTEILAMPILSSETGEPIAGIVLGFKPAEFAGARADPGIRRGVWLDGELYLDALPPAENHALAAEVTQAIAREAGAAGRFSRQVARGEQWVFYKQLNPDSEFPPAYEVCVYPLTELQARQQRLRWQVLGAGGLLLLVGGVASHVVASRLARPVERLEDDSEENRAQRQRAEAALESTSEELQRAARFSADASHQLKTPVTVLRAGLEELLARDEWGPAECHEISALIHQTYRLSSVIEDLLLLSRMDAGRLKIEFKAVDLSHLIDAALDD
ncbi:MAG TPA: histidine kinase dimerization/phospho-acceptor domain-containing protein, partial [Opitutus sp.]|nr:histidine kinase dimerization/phospho-acceptor domain-containing protein [Opitutus sp.]